MFIYIFGNNVKQSYKVGISKNPDKRIKQLQTGCPFSINVVYKIETPHARKVESWFHQDYSDLNTSGEWFLLNPEDLTKAKKYILETVDYFDYVEKFEKDYLEKNPGEDFNKIAKMIKNYRKEAGNKNKEPDWFNYTSITSRKNFNSIMKSLGAPIVK